jgi:predicted ATP-grasp superfamily ATP-dependent carboligase
MPDSNPPALVFGADITGLAVLRSLGRNGVPAFVAGSRTTIVARSRWYRRAPGVAIEETSDGERVAEYLRTLPFERAVLFPCADHWALALASLPEGVADSYPAAVAPARVLRILVDKELFADAAAQLGVPAPRTIPVTRAEDIDGVTEDELRRFFLKPRDSQLFARRFGVKALRLDRRRRATELVNRVASEGLEALLQEFIPGPPTAHVFLDGYVDRGGVMRACLARRRLRMYPTEFGNSTLSVTMPLREAGEAVGSLRRLLEGIGYVGLFDAEFKYDARDGLFKVLEVNARPWWQLELAGASGLDLPLMAYRDSLGLSVPTASGYRVGRTWVHPVPDIRAWWAARARGEVVGGLPPRSWFRGANAVFSWDDPMPVADELARLTRQAVDAAHARWTRPRVGSTRPAAEPPTPPLERPSTGRFKRPSSRRLKRPREVDALSR